jgi:hypothetical protein
MKILVCGGRDYQDKDRVTAVLNEYINQVEAIVHGAGRGADTLAGEWANENNIREIKYPAEWTEFGLGAGFKRNTAMLSEKPDIVIAFPGGRGTAMMKRLARKAVSGLLKFWIKLDKDAGN